jgi:hypothetical protein
LTRGFLRNFWEQAHRHKIGEVNTAEAERISELEIKDPASPKSATQGKLDKAGGRSD